MLFLLLLLLLPPLLSRGCSFPASAIPRSIQFGRSLLRVAIVIEYYTLDRLSVLWSTSLWRLLCWSGLFPYIAVRRSIPFSKRVLCVAIAVECYALDWLRVLWSSAHLIW